MKYQMTYQEVQENMEKLLSNGYDIPPANITGYFWREGSHNPWGVRPNQKLSERNRLMWANSRQGRVLVWVLDEDLWQDANRFKQVGPESMVIATYAAARVKLELKAEIDMLRREVERLRELLTTANHDEDDDPDEYEVEYFNESPPHPDSLLSDWHFSGR